MELPPGSLDLRHDRAVFHFLADPAQRRGYAAALLIALKPGGFAILATFAPDGPTHRSEAAAILTGLGHSPGEIDFGVFLRA